MDSSLSCRTKDALSVEVDCSFQFNIRPNLDDVVELYKNFGEDYHVPIIKMARNTLRDTMAKFEAIEVFFDRSSVVSQMQIDLTEALETYSFLVDNFQLLDINLPSAFSSSL